MESLTEQRAKGMTMIIQNHRQFLAGVMTIALGMLLYVAIRPSWQTFWTIDLISLEWREFWFLRMIGNNLPSFLHVVGLSLLTAAVVAKKKSIYMVICCSWLSINLVFEFLQSDVAYARLNHWSVNHEIMNPMVQWFKNYSLNAIYDTSDVLALFIGAVLAYIILLKTGLADRRANKTA
ncbi:hypothetical protein FK220_011040 [Flavobacteriaceae bacterium TP-CH-4]|uniref:Uncharacterized protein n=1 Tax=Pelagihabitans pacificus TaxID=2696054 RepID=A0A967AVK7_9FLAO|nr:hypothetical protein [Pelagihabitans pacificus]NHF59878.1 hypothetical protein [Pelagihabitans pacificus]